MNAANFTFTPFNKPSIFEIIAQKSLRDGLYPALQRISLYLSANNPQRFEWLGKHFDEIFLALSLGIQYNYLKSYDASFSENFYGLKRVLMSTNGSMSEYHRILSVFFEVLFPYFKHKIDENINYLRLEEADGCLRNNMEGKFKKSLIMAHSFVQVSWSLMVVYNYIKYMSGQSATQLPTLKLINLKLVYAEPVPEGPTFWNLLFKGQFRDLWHLNLLRNCVGSTLTVSAFFLQFLQSWQSERANFSITALPKVAPPPVDYKAVNFMKKCPLCYQHWKIPSVLPVSGYVFCFSCIFRHLREHQTCPVTQLPAKPLDIVRLYED